MNTDGRHFPLVSERNEELLSKERGFRGDSAPHWREAEGGAVDATWSVSRCNVERMPMQRGAWADATWSVCRCNVERKTAPRKVSLRNALGTTFRGRQNS